MPTLDSVVSEPNLLAKKILVVDDNEEVLKILKRILLKLGYDARTYSDPLQAIKEFEMDPPDLILTDMKMPGMDGIEFLTQIKRKNPTIPVILMTAYATIENAVLAARWGALDYLKKPFEIKMVTDVIQKALLPPETKSS